MAIHIDNVESWGYCQVDKADFYEQLEWGDLIFCCGQEQISKDIEAITCSPFSHVLMAWLPGRSDAVVDSGINLPSGRARG